ncbi:MAG: hypothetical protein ACT4P0_13410 [Panacagrimonas sp.]
MAKDVRKPDVPSSADEKKPAKRINVAVQMFIWADRLYRLVDLVEKHGKEWLSTLTDL